MGAIIQYYDSLGLDFTKQALSGVILFFGLLIAFGIGRFIFGRHSNINHAISSAISILFAFLLVICLQAHCPQYRKYIAPMPFVTLGSDQLALFPFSGVHYTSLCAQLLSMIQLAFLTNLVDSWMPRKNNILAWAFFRTITVVFALILHLAVCNLLQHYLPQGIIVYSPAILVGILIALLFTGALKIPAGVFMLTVNPIIAALYTFFFANFIGRLLSRSIITTALLVALSYALNYFKIYAIPTTKAALISYIPFYLILAVFWYLVRSKKKVSR